jgi:hypothetical protein
MKGNNEAATKAAIDAIQAQGKAASSDTEGYIVALTANAIPIAKGASLTAGAIAAAKLAATINKTTAPVYIAEAITEAGVFARNKIKEAITQVSISKQETLVKAAKRKSVVTEVGTLPPFDTPDKADEPYLGIIADGMPVYGSIILGDVPAGEKAITWVDNNGANAKLPRIPIAVAIVQATPSKNIVKTNINGRDGSIKEYTGLNDVNITIDCTIHYPINQSREDILRQIDLFYQCPYAVPVTNQRLNALGVTHIVIENMNYNQRPGEYSSLFFTIQASQDIPITDILP